MMGGNPQELAAHPPHNRRTAHSSSHSLREPARLARCENNIGYTMINCCSNSNNYILLIDKTEHVEPTSNYPTTSSS